MNQSINFNKFLKRLVIYEGLRTKAYKDSVGKWTIGIGTIRYPNGTPVKAGDVITEAQAYEYATVEAEHMFRQLTGMLKVEQSENQLIALLCLMYNIGVTGLKNSSVLKSINGKEPLERIEQNWMMWNKGRIKGVLTEIKGLTVRRKSEVKIYKGFIGL
jgi:lysozyme